MVGSAAIKQGRSANRKHTYFFFGLIIIYTQAMRFQINMIIKPNISAPVL